ncbi:hypothetical protein [Roseibium aggregatum]|uniref:Uncharacterized protein n=1 Tax=Roseibium aggregatum TaxID=187304 RepID=A0A0M6Y7V7_9HYPH|nr:hypothetical protein [Roseibium aggregatum]CTQ45758.1 hypothetical protein LAL4801_04213 [Roseibium aggregatum]
MAAIPGAVPVGGFIGPTDDTDVYPTIDPLYGVDGLRSVPDHATRDAIPPLRRRAGMVVVTQNDLQGWQLAGDLVTWVPFAQSRTKRVTFTSTREIVISGVDQPPLAEVYITRLDPLPFTFDTQPFDVAQFDWLDRVTFLRNANFTSIFDEVLKTLTIRLPGSGSGIVVYNV